MTYVDYRSRRHSPPRRSKTERFFRGTGNSVRRTRHCWFVSFVSWPPIHPSA